MKIRTSANKGLTIGIPRALLYFRYKVLWHAFFRELGVNVIYSEPTTKEIMQQGTKRAIDEMCLSTKIFLGHVESLVGKCDYILVPRISNYGVRVCMCTKFEALYDMTRNVFRDTQQKFIAYNVDDIQKITEEKAFVALGESLGFPTGVVQKAYRAAKKQQKEHHRNRVRKQEELFKRPGIKIMVAAHSYVLEDPYIGRPIVDYLKELGVVVVRADFVPRPEALKVSEKVSPTLKWELPREIVGGLKMNEKRIDGIVLLSVFPCGPDSMVNELIVRKFKDVPILHMILDEQSGQAGNETRLESFVDIIRMKGGNL